jgi:hypothetical protein
MHPMPWRMHGHSLHCGYVGRAGQQRGCRAARLQGAVAICRRHARTIVVHVVYAVHRQHRGAGRCRASDLGRQASCHPWAYLRRSHAAAQWQGCDQKYDNPAEHKALRCSAPIGSHLTHQAASVLGLAYLQQVELFAPAAKPIAHQRGGSHQRRSV